MKEKEKKKAPSDEIVLPYIPEIPIPDPPVPNRAHTEMVIDTDANNGSEILSNRRMNS